MADQSAPTSAPGEGEEPAAAAAAELSVKVHPIVVFSVLDHYIRRQEGQERVIGTLLGSVDAATGVVEVTNAYAVPHTETKEGEVAVGQQFNKTMFSLLSRVNACEQIVGWYATVGSDGAHANDSSSLIHEFYAKECGRAVHVVVDPRLDGDKGVEVAAYELPSPAAGAAPAFAPLPCAHAFNDGEKVCIDRMIRGQAEPFATAESVATLPSDRDTVRTDMDALLEQVDLILSYADAVKAGEVECDPTLARCLGDALTALPKIEEATNDGSLNAETQDIVMVSYLASITKAQLAIAAKIHESF